MTLTIESNHTLVIGTRKFKVLRVVWSGTYATGGQVLTGEELGVDRIGFIHVTSGRSADGHEQVSFQDTTNALTWRNPLNGQQESPGALPANFRFTILVEDAD